MLRKSMLIAATAIALLGATPTPSPKPSAPPIPKVIATPAPPDFAVAACSRQNAGAPVLPYAQVLPQGFFVLYCAHGRFIYIDAVRVPGP